MSCPQPLPIESPDTALPPRIRLVGWRGEPFSEAALRRQNLIAAAELSIDVAPNPDERRMLALLRGPDCPESLAE